MSYTDRVISQTLQWVNGISKHNHVDGECVVDFSCCHPDLFEKSLNKRMDYHKSLLEKLGRGECAG